MRRAVLRGEIHAAEAAAGLKAQRSAFCDLGVGSVGSVGSAEGSGSKHMKFSCLFWIHNYKELPCHGHYVRASSAQSHEEVINERQKTCPASQQLPQLERLSTERGAARIRAICTDACVALRDRRSTSAA